MQVLCHRVILFIIAVMCTIMRSSVQVIITEKSGDNSFRLDRASVIRQVGNL